eukprot:7943554-Karenia_brevis.AAC.1
MPFNGRKICTRRHAERQSADLTFPNGSEPGPSAGSRDFGDTLQEAMCRVLLPDQPKATVHIDVRAHFKRIDFPTAMFNVSPHTILCCVLVL